MFKASEMSTEFILAKVAEVGPICHTNKAKGVLAICSMPAVRLAEETYGSKMRKGLIPSTRAVRFPVDPTFTFAMSSSSYRPVHTGTQLDGYMLLKRILTRMFGGLINFDPTDKIDRAHLDNIAKILFKEDPRIYVPFTGDEFDLLECWTFSSTTMDMAWNTLWQSVPVL